jgi:hypothetical protein
MAVSKTRNEANTALIIFLILFVITTIGLAVSTYTGYAAEDNKEGALAKEKTRAEAIEAERDWYKFCALLFLEYTGELQGDILAEEAKEYKVLQAKFLPKRAADGGIVGTGSLPDPKMTEQPKVLPKATVEKILTRMEDTFRYKEDEGALKLDSTLAKAVDSAKDTYKDAAARQKALKRSKDEAEANAAQARAQTATDKKVYEVALQAAQDGVSKELKLYQNQFDDLKKANTRLTQDLNAEREKAQKDASDFNTKIGDLAKENTRLQKIIDERLKVDEIRNEEKQSGETARKVPTDFRIVELDARGLLGYINAGSADHVTPQLTFNVFGVTPDGRVESTSKATIEVVNVVDAHLSQVRVTGQRVQKLDRSIAMLSPTEIVTGREKVLSGLAKNDVVHNPAWHPGIKRHVAIAGIIDLNGDPRNALADFTRLLDKQNMVVDAYIDLRDGEIHGKITVQTDYLILGSGPEAIAEGTRGDLKAKLNEKIDAMRKQAKNNGVEMMNVKRFLDVIGYRFPTTATGSLSGSYRYLPEFGDGGDKKEEKKPDAPPAEPKP